MAKKRPGYIIIALAAGALAAGLLLRPETALAAAREGLERFALLLLPSLLPFFICAEILRRSGVLRSAGRLLEKPMRALFRLGGESGAVCLIGAVSGYPSGARLAGELFGEKKLSLPETERLCLLANLCGPLYIAGAVATGILAQPQAAAPILIAQYAGAWLVTAVYARIFPSAASRPSLPREDRLPPGALIGGSAYDAMLAMLKVGAITTLFTVILRLCESVGALDALDGLAARTLGVFGISPQFGRSLAIGLFEVSAACVESAQAAVSLRSQAALCSALCAFGGLSVVMQTLAFAPIRTGRFIVAKLAHALLAAALTAAIFPFFCADAPAFAVQAANSAWRADLSIILGLLTASAIAVGAIALVSLLFTAKRT